MAEKDRDDENAFDRPGLGNGTVRLQQNLFRRFCRNEGKNCQEDQWYNHTLEMLAFPPGSAAVLMMLRWPGCIRSALMAT